VLQYENVIALIKQPGRSFGPAPAASHPRQANRPLTSSQRIHNYAIQLGTSRLTAPQMRRITKKDNRLKG
jgi:hypothetical protein